MTPTLIQLKKPQPVKSPEATERAIFRQVGAAIRDYNLIENGDRVMVAVSGGKDSYTLLHILRMIQRKAPVRFELVAANVHPGWDHYPTGIIETYLRGEGYEYRMERTQMKQVIEEKMDPKDTLCSMCARLRRGVLYRVAKELGANKVALGHHADDLIETLLLSVFFQGEIRSMPPRLFSDDGQHVVIRPMCYVPEEYTRRYALYKGFPVVCCGCPICGDTTLQRPKIKGLLKELESQNPRLKRSMLAALGHINLAHLMDKRYLPVNGANPESSWGPGLAESNPPPVGPSMEGPETRIS
ncbi:MAG: tRNA 2-thiocytidine(32) synthetase TtcA [Acidobacteria bacterium]|nr:tRNA 2-thiocytidine(32) synthetase TtcA [Acidobacteriota bacterium]